jgi:hypothetical protein
MQLKQSRSCDTKEVHSAPGLTNLRNIQNIAVKIYHLKALYKQ